jgi:hypothetical protein
MSFTRPTPNGDLGSLYMERRLNTAAEVLSKLIFLTSSEAENPAKVRHYIALAEEQMSILSGGS